MIARGTGFVRGSLQTARARLGAHLRYLVHRAIGNQEQQHQRALFSKDADHLSQQDALKAILQHSLPRLRYHKFVLSPAAHEPVYHWQAWTRSVLGDLEQRLGQRLCWYALVHRNTDNHHVHVVLAGAGEHLVTGQRLPVRLTVQEYQFLRARGAAHSEEAWHRQLAGISASLDNQERFQNLQPFTDLLPGEGAVGLYSVLTRQGKRGDALTPHHMPAAALMERYGVSRDQGMCFTMEQLPWGAGRHRLTRSYGVGIVQEDERPRQSLARDIANARAIYLSQDLLTPEVNRALREVIAENKRTYPVLFAKQKESEG